jgi:predicted nuclease of restriction endonuclease-like RecB superfamily
MLPLQLLRIRIGNKGKNISPVFCKYNNDCNSSELQLATKMIEEFEETWKKEERKGVLGERVAELESQYDAYKLVRGFYTLLERRCVFSSMKKMVAGVDDLGNSDTAKIFDANIASITYKIHPYTIRRELFEESSKRGFASTDVERTEIMDAVASRLGLSRQDMAAEMWSDLEENLILKQFCKITPEQLMAWYNLSLMQTLLFNCTKLEFSVYGGSNWKRVLRDVKRLGLMYNLQHQKRDEQTNDIQPSVDMAGSEDPGRNNAIIVCSIDGPLSVFKLTDRYGTAIAKLLPSIVSANTWSIRAWIVRKTISSGKKMYEFEMSNKESPLLRDPYRDGLKINEGKGDSPSSNYFDSSVEEKFANKFEQSATGWKLIREPDPLILSDGKALIPDFMFEKYDRRVYLEIVGFWTKEYLERKLRKITDVTKAHNNDNFDFFIAINNDYYATPNSTNNRGKLSNSQTLSTFVDRDHLIIYKNDNVPLKHILEYLKSIELEMVEKYATRNYKDLSSHLNHIITGNADNGVIAIHEIAKKCNIPIESALRIIRSEQEKVKDKGDNASSYIITDKYLISKSKAKELGLLLMGIRKFNEACLLFEKNNIPEPCHVDLLSELGFDIIWKGIDSNSATIERRL